MKALAAALCGLLLAALPSTALAGTVYSTFSPSHTYGSSSFGIGAYPSGSNQVLAEAFVPSETVTLSEAILALSQSGDNPFNLYVESDSGGVPGTILDTLTQVGGSTSTPSLVTFTCSSCSVLDAGTEYS